MKILVVGSFALRNALTVGQRVPKDLDIIGSYDDIIEYLKQLKVKSIIPSKDGSHIVAKSGVKLMSAVVQSDIIEAEIAWAGSSAEAILAKYPDSPKVQYASLSDLYWIKMSHRFKKNSPHFEKTRDDIMMMRRLLAGQILGPQPDWFEQREKESYNYSHPNLNVKKADFFQMDAGVDYKYDHDSIHEVIAAAFHCCPAYKLFLDGEVKCSKSKFDRLPEWDKLRAVYEESMVLALERSQIPFAGMPDCPTPEDSYKMALQKVCTSITSGWFREYAWENYDKALGYKTEPYLDWFKYAVNRGEVALNPKYNAK